MSEIAIIGAGLGGMTLALALLRDGRKVRVYESAPELGEVGAGITLSPNSSRVMIALGLGEALERDGVVPGKQWTQDLRTGEVLHEFDRGHEMGAKYGAPYVHLHRADLHGLIAEAVQELDPGAVILGHHLIEVDASGLMHFANGETARAGLVVGADGVKSQVRDCLYETGEAEFTGQVAWRGVVRKDTLAEDVAQLPPGIWIGERRLFMRYPMRGGDLVNFAAFVSVDGWDEEGWAIPSTIAELDGHYADAEPRLRALIAATPPDKLFKWALRVRDPLDTWIAGNVVLMGDAAHAMLPFMGQGAGTAIEDAMVLARCLAAFPQTKALKRYEAARLERTSMIQEQSRLLGMRFQGKDPQSYGKGGIKNEETMGLFDYNALTVEI